MELFIAFIAVGSIAATIGTLLVLVHERAVAEAHANAWKQSADDALRALGATQLVDHVGCVGPLTVELTNELENTRVLVSGMAGRKGQLSLRGARVGIIEQATSGQLGEHDVETGDPDFDDRVRIEEGPELLGRALLDVSARSSFLGLLDREIDVALADDRLSARLNHERIAELTPVIEDLVAFAEQLIAPEDVAARIADNIQAEPRAAARGNCLRALGGEFPEHAATRPAMLAAVGDSDEGVRMQAALAFANIFGDVTALLDFARTGRSSGSNAARAVEAIGAGLSVVDARAIIEASLRPPRPAVVVACLEALGEGDRSDADAALVSALEGDEYSEEMRIVAARSLGRVGSAGSIPALRAAEARHRGGWFERAARQAVAEIQSRIDASPGQLSLTDGELGQLSLSKEPGQLSAVEDVSRDSTPDDE